MAKKARKVLKQESYQRAIQQSMANVNTTTVISGTVAQPVVATPAAVAKPTQARASGLEISAEQEFNYVRSDVRKSLTLAAIFTAILVALSFVIK
jgi:hypothetical protein